MMKKEKLVLALLCLGSVAIAQSSVTLGTFGFQKQHTQGTVLRMAGAPFFVGESNSVVEVLGDTLPIGSKVYTYVSDAYQSAEYKIITEAQGFPPVYVPVDTNWVESGFALDLSVGFWVSTPTAGSYESTISGDIPMDVSMDVPIAAGLNLLSNPYPVDSVVTNMGFDPSIGDIVYTFDGSIYQSAEYKVITEAQGFPPVYVPVDTNWVDGAFSIPIGEGFWYKAVAPQTWVSVRPYGEL